MPQCIVNNCKNRTRSRPVLGQIKEKNINNVSYHRFPKNEQLKSLWLNVLGLKAESVKTEVRICSAHFAEDAFHFLNGTKRLQPNALPSKEHVVKSIQNIPNSVTDTLEIDRATSPFPGCSHSMDQSINMSPKGEYNSLKEEYFHKKLQETRNFYLRKIKVLQQGIRRKDSRIIALKAILDPLKKNNMLETEELQILQDIDSTNSMPAIPGSSTVTKKTKKSNESESSNNSSMFSPPARTVRRKTFSVAWLENPDFAPWLKKCDDPHKAKCTVCNKIITAGKSELLKHKNGLAHMTNVDRRKEVADGRVSFNYRGLITSVLTPFNNDSTRTLNLSIIPQYANYLARRKITGILVNGTSGEGPSMTTSERKLVAEAWANAVRTTKQHLMIQVGGTSLPDVLELAKHAENINADSILCLPELYFKPRTLEQLKDYLKLVSLAAPNTPLLYYHIPSLTNVNVHMAQFLQSINEDIPTFVGIKFSSPSLDEAAQAFHTNDNKFAVFLENDQLITAACALGINSFITTASNMFSELVLDTIAAGLEGNFLKGKETQQRLTSAVINVSKYGTWVETMKTAMTLLTNINPGPPRAPQTPLFPKTVVSMAKDLQNLGFDFLQDCVRYVYNNNAKMRTAKGRRVVRNCNDDVTLRKRRDV